MANDGFWQQRFEIEQLAQDRFAPLASKLGWTELRRQHNRYQTSYYYMLTQQLGLEIYMEWHDEYVEVYLVRLNKGKRPRDSGLFSITSGEGIRTPVRYLLDTLLHVEDEWLAQQWQSIQR